MHQAIFSMAFAISLVAVITLSAVVHAIFSFFSPQKPSKRLAAGQVIVSMISLLGAFTSAAVSVFVRAAAGVLRWWVLFFGLFAVLSMLYVTYEDYPEVWFGFIRMYNSYLGPWIQFIFVIPLKFVDIIARAVLPIWDSYVWFFRALWVQGLFPIVVKEAETFYKIAGALQDFVVDSSMSLMAFVDSFFCSGAVCLRPEQHVVDVVTGMNDLRKLAVHVTDILRVICGSFSAPLDLILYPFMDLNLAEGVHNLVNSATQLVFAIPHTAAERCRMSSKDSPFYVMMCTPDLAPFWNFLVAGVGNFGILVDNWLNVAFLIVVQATTGIRRTCDPSEVGMLPDLIINSTIFSGRQTAVVGLTDWMYAVTDGRSRLI